MQLSQYIHVLRFFSFFVTLIAFICHLSQCLLLNKYKDKTGIPDWLEAGHWQYLAWYISLVLSLVGSFAVCVNATYFNGSTKYTKDKCVGSLVIVLLLVSIITAISVDYVEPWSNGYYKLERPSNSLLTYCSVLDALQDEFYPLLYQRCILNDCTWILAILICSIWVCLVGFTTFASRKIKAGMPKDAVRPTIVKEPKWGRYIPDPPSSIYSATTLCNRLGLLTPSSILTREKHSEFYYNCSISNFPTSPTYDYCYSDHYAVKSKDDYYEADYKEALTYDCFARGDHDSKRFLSSYYHGSGNKKEEDRKCGSRSSPYSSRQLLSVAISSSRGSSSPPLSEEEPELATTITTPLYSKFCSSNQKCNDTFSLGLNYSNSY